MINHSLIRYDLLGTQPSVENIDLEGSIAKYQTLRLGAEKHVLGAKLARAAEHFFGLSLDDFRSMPELVDVMVAMNQDARVH